MANTKIEILASLTGVDDLLVITDRFPARLANRLLIALTAITDKWHEEAAKRAPVRTGALRNKIVSEVVVTRAKIVAAVGSNQHYAPHVEFGTDRIAGGAVKALGMGVVTDDQAIKNWPAKARDRQGVLSPELLQALERQGLDEQMPWLRTAWSAIADWASRLLDKAVGEI